jgi:mRNA-degrading endonuclease toxin of MazEF toxin-antitoxin module
MYKTGINLWNEISRENPFMRPCIILNNFIGWDLLLIVPLSTKKHQGKYEIEITEYPSYGLYQNSYALINQIKPISKRRLVYKLNGYNNWERRVKLVGKNILDAIKIGYMTKILKI